jgi:hypothetical protein
MLRPSEQCDYTMVISHLKVKHVITGASTRARETHDNTMVPSHSQVKLLITLLCYDTFKWQML